MSPAGTLKSELVWQNWSFITIQHLAENSFIQYNWPVSRYCPLSVQNDINLIFTGQNTGWTMNVSVRGKHRLLYIKLQKRVLMGLHFRETNKKGNTISLNRPKRKLP